MATVKTSTTTTTTMNLHMTIRYEEKKDDDQLILSIEEDSAVISIEATEDCPHSTKDSSNRTVHEEASDRLQISSSLLPSFESPSGVRFGHVSIRHYPVIVGDNPGGHSGPPLSIGWEHYDEVTLDVLEYEDQRPPRRKGREMLVPADVRTDRLREVGYSRTEIVALTKQVNIARSQRRRTLDTLHLQPLFQLHEKLSRKTFSLFTSGRRKKAERTLLAHHRREAADTDGQESLPFSAASTGDEDDLSSCQSSLPHPEEEPPTSQVDEDNGMIAI